MWIIWDLVQNVWNFDGLIYFVVALMIGCYCLNEFYLYQKRKQVDLTGKTVLVTGGGNGFGKELCTAFARNKCNIITVDVNVEGNKDTIERVKAINKDGKHASFICDVSDPEKVKEMAKLIYKEFDTIDILVNNAGISIVERLLDMEERHIKAQIDVNLMSHFWMIKTFVPQMVSANSGYVVATSSILGRLGVECVAPYCASKFAVSGLMESLQQELMQINSNVKTLTIHPGFMATNILPTSLNQPGVNFFKNWVPFYVQRPEDVARKVVRALKEEQRELYVPHFYIQLTKLINELPLFMRDYLTKSTFKLYAFSHEATKSK